MKSSLALDARRQTAEGLYPVCILLTEGTYRKWVRTGKVVSKEDWVRIRKGIRLSEELSGIRDYCEAKRLSYSVIEVGLDPHSTDILEYMKLKEERLKAAGRYGSQIVLWNARASLEKFTKGKMTIIDHKFLDKWRTFIGGSLTTQSMYLRQLRTVCRELRITPYPFEGYTVPSGKGRKLHLTEEELVSLWTAKVTPKVRLYLDHWFLSYFLAGMNLVDLCSMRWENIEGDVLYFVREKTMRSSGKTICILIPDEAFQIMKRIGTLNVSYNYILPHFAAGGDKKAIINLLGKLINKYTRIAATSVGITKKLITYSARHSYATTMLRLGAPLKIISDSLGHTSLKTTEGYLGSMDNSVGRVYASKLLDTKSSAKD